MRCRFCLKDFDTLQDARNHEEVKHDFNLVTYTDQGVAEIQMSKYHKDKMRKKP